MRILMISRHHPFPTDHGAAQRSAIIIKALSLIGVVDVAVVGDERIPAEVDPGWFKYVATLRLRPEEIARCPGAPQWLPLLHRACRFFFVTGGFRHVPRISREMHEIIHRGKYDVVVARYLTTFTLCKLQGVGRVVVDVDDLPSQAFETIVVNRQKNPLFKLIRRIQLLRVRSQTAKVARMCQHIWLPNSDQVPHFPNASWLPNIPCPFGDLQSQQEAIEEEPRRVLFVGLMGYAPNSDAMDFYIREVWPKVIQVMPDAELRIVGGGLSKQLWDEWSRVPGVSIAGYVHNLTAEYSRCALVVAPIFSGGGTNIKVLEAMSHQRACLVSVPTANRFGDLLEDGKTAMIASSPGEFAQKTIRLLSDPELRRRIGAAGHAAMKDTYSFNAICHEVTRTIEAVVERDTCPNLAESPGKYH